MSRLFLDHPTHAKCGEEVRDHPVDEQAKAGDNQSKAPSDKQILDCNDNDPTNHEQEADNTGNAEFTEHIVRAGGANINVSLWRGILKSLNHLAIEVASMTDNEGRKDLRMPDDTEVFAVVTDMLGANRVRVRCMDGVERTARIPGKMQKRIWIREDDVVLVEPWDWQDEKADITWRYEKQEADQLRNEGHIQQ